MYYLLLSILLMGAERGAELRTLEPVLYGKFEARYKPAQGEGLVSSFLFIMMIPPIHPGLRLILNFWDVSQG